MINQTRMSLCALTVFLLIVPGALSQDQVFRSVTPDAVEKMLQENKIEFKKSTPKQGDEVYFDFTRNNFRVRLTVFSKEEMMLDCVFRGVTLEKVNQWNASTRLTRVNWTKDTSGEMTVLEYGLDISGGATANTFKQFINRYDEELKKYDKFVLANN